MKVTFGELLYESPGSFKSLWNTYRIYEDRIELEFRLFFSRIVIPREAFVSVEVYRPPVVRTSFWALKLDWADFYTHVGIERNCGLFKKLRFTPADPEEFKQNVIEWASR